MGGIVVLYPIGWGYVMWKAGLTFQATVLAAVPFVIGDIIKCVFVGLVATAVHRAYPWLMPAKPKATADASPAVASGTTSTGEPEESGALATA